MAPHDDDVDNSSSGRSPRKTTFTTRTNPRVSLPPNLRTSNRRPSNLSYAPINISDLPDLSDQETPLERGRQPLELGSQRAVAEPRSRSPGSNYSESPRETALRFQHTTLPFRVVGSPEPVNTDKFDNPGPAGTPDNSLTGLTISAQMETKKRFAGFDGSKGRIGFLDLDVKIQKQIISHVLVTPAIMRPYYRKGMHRLGLRADPNVDSTVHTDNMNLALLSVMKHLNTISSEVFYGQNWFFFNDANVAKWWFKSIGLKNISNIRSVRFRMYSGWVDVDRENKSCIDLCEEERWFQVICFMQFRQNLNKFEIFFSNWHPMLSSRGWTEDDRDEVLKWRGKVVEKLKRFRAIDHGNACQEQCAWLTPKELDAIGVAMKTPWEDALWKKRLI